MHASFMALFAHCASQTVNAVRLSWERKPRAHATADRLASALALDMTEHWTPMVRDYLGRITKAHILAAVREAVSDEARIASPASRSSRWRKPPRSFLPGPVGRHDQAQAGDNRGQQAG